MPQQPLHKPARVHQCLFITAGPNDARDFFLIAPHGIYVVVLGISVHENAPSIADCETAGRPVAKSGSGQADGVQNEQQRLSGTGREAFDFFPVQNDRANPPVNPSQIILV